MKKIGAAVVLVGALVGGVYYASPYLVLNELRQAVAAKDSEVLKELIDFPSVRQSLKDQFNVILASNMAAEAKDNPFAAVSTRGTGDDRIDERPKIYLLGIREWGDGTYRAQIYTRTRKWYEEGESFEAYQLIAINPEEQTVEIFSEKHGRSFTYEVVR